MFNKCFKIATMLLVVCTWFILLHWSSDTQGKEIGTDALSGKITTRIPDVFVSFDPGKDTDYAILVEKDTQQLFLYAYDGAYRLISHLESSTGEVSGPKSISGDKKTPEGAYFFTNAYLKRDLSPIYGTRAFPTNYPNFLDRMEGKTGSAIWMHGTNKPLKKMDTNGCIVLENGDIDMLSDYITLNRTPIIIVNKVSYESADTQEKKKASLMKFLSTWENALEKGTYHQYLDHYDPEYLPEILWWPEWFQTRQQFLSSSFHLSVDLEQKMIVKHNGVYLVSFDQIIRSDDIKLFVGTRNLYIKEKDDVYMIVGETYRDLSKKKREKRRGNPMEGVSHNLKTLIVEKREIPYLIDRWLKAWSSKDIKGYGECYTKDFQSQTGKNLSTWLAYKSRLNKQYDYIRISIEDLVVHTEKTRSTASFVQRYDSSGYHSVSKKQLVFIREGGKWKIFREISEKI